MPRRRRNEDGSLIVPLSPRQQEALAKGRAALAAKVAGDRAGQGEPPADEGQQRGGRRVDVVDLTKASGGGAKARKRASSSSRTKASGSRSRSSASRTAATSEPSSSKESRGLGERFVDWLSST